MQKNFLFFCLSLPAFHVLHRYNEYYRLLSFSQAVGHFLIYAVSFFVIYLGMKKLLVAPGKAAWFTLELMILFFFFGAVRDGLRKTSFPAAFTAYKIILPFILIVILGLFFYVKKEKHFRTKKIYFFNLLFVVFVVFELLSLSVNIYFKKDTKNDFKISGLPALAPVRVNNLLLPDIYIIVLDEYTSSDCLKEEFNFDNSRFDSLLLASHFFISRKSKSNYNITPFSVASTLNLDYLKEDLKNKKMTGKLLLQGVYTLKNSWLPSFLQQQGYIIKNYSLFDLAGYPAAHTPYFEYIRNEVNATPTLFGNIRRDIWWNTSGLPFINAESGIFKRDRRDEQIHLSNNQFNFDRLAKEITLSETAPKFVYCHLMLPHEAFLLDKHGKILPDSVRGKADIRSLYLGQLEYANSLIERILPAFNKTNARPGVVVLEGDHGFRFYDELSDKRDIFRNLNAYYFSDGLYTGLYDSISPVNSFRVVLNKYFNQHLPLQPDAQVFINDSAELIME